MASMRCPACVGLTRILETRSRADGVTRRRRVCSRCSNRFTTWEEIGRSESSVPPSEPWDTLPITPEPPEPPVISSAGYLRGIKLAGIGVTLPPANPTDPETRLLRALYGLCPDCDLSPEDHANNPHGVANDD